MGQHFKNRYNEVDLSDIIDDYVNHKKSLLTIGIDYDMSPSTIRDLLLRNGIELRPPSRMKTKVEVLKVTRAIDPMGNARISYEKILEGLDLYKSKLSLDGLSRFWSCSVTAAIKILKFHDIIRHTCGWREGNGNGR